MTLLSSYFLTLASIGFLVSSCKYSPNQIRSTLKSAGIYQYLEEGSIIFNRAADRRSGTLNFAMTQPYQCAVIYWAEDLNEPPFEDSPRNYPCPENQTEVSMSFSGLKPIVPYTFKIMVWPKKLSSVSSAFILLKERQGLRELKTESLIVNQYINPRQTSETYVHRLEQAKTLLEVQEDLSELYSGSLDKCQEDPIERNFPYLASNSRSDDKGRPLHGLSDVSTDGYAQGISRIHKFFQDRIVTNMSGVDQSQNMTWFLSWENKSFSFETFPPTRMKNFSINIDSNPIEINHRDLKSVQPVYSVGKTSPEFTATALYPGDYNFIHLQIRDPLSTKKPIYCVFKAGKSVYTIPEDIYKNLVNGTYEITAILESVLLHYKSGLPYPPWVITYQDLIHSKFEKVL